jgi:hypothetical protein
MLDWDTAAPAQAHEDEAAFAERVTTAGEFTMRYAGDGVGCDIYSYDIRAYLTRADDPEADDAHAVVLTTAEMNALARDWLRYRGRWPWMQDE